MMAVVGFDPLPPEYPYVMWVSW